MDTKSKGDIAEQSVVLRALEMGWGVLKPVGDRLPYDLVFDVNGVLIKIQVKYAWLRQDSMNFTIDTRRTKTNRREMKVECYNVEDFDFAIIFVHPLRLFWVIPIDVFLSYSGAISLVIAPNRQRKSKIDSFRNAWNLIQARASSEEILARISVKVGEASDLVIPSQAPKKGEGVET